MILKLDKEDAKEVIKEFADNATYIYMNQKIKQLFDNKIGSIIDNYFKKNDIEKYVKNAIEGVIRRALKEDWPGRSVIVKEIIKERLEEIDIEKIITDDFKKDVAEEVFRSMVFNKKK